MAWRPPKSLPRNLSAMIPAKGIAMERPLCPYPQEAHYKGAGSTTDPASFECVNAPRNLKLSPPRKASGN